VPALGPGVVGRVGDDSAVADLGNALDGGAAREGNIARAVDLDIARVGTRMPFPAVTDLGDAVGVAAALKSDGGRGPDEDVAAGAGVALAPGGVRPRPAVADLSV